MLIVNSIVGAFNNMNLHCDGSAHNKAKTPQVRYICLIQLLILIKHLYVSVVWVRCGSKNGYKKDMISKEIGLPTQNMLIILILTINIIVEDLHNHFMSTIIFNFILNKIVSPPPC
jgi:hypothetical protein